MLVVQLEILRFIEENPNATRDQIAKTLQERKVNDTEVVSQDPFSRVVSKVMGLLRTPHGKIVQLMLWELELAHYIVRPWHPDTMEILVDTGSLPRRKCRLTKKGRAHLREHQPELEPMSTR